MSKNRNCIYIPSIDGKDLYLTNTYKDQSKNETGYRLVTKDGHINYNRFINSFDFSLDREKIREMAKEVYGKKDTFSFLYNGKEYSDKIINVTFKYSSKDFNQIKKNTYVMAGYQLDELRFQDHIATEDGIIVGIVTSVPTNEKISLELPEGFDYTEDENGNYVYSIKTIGVAQSRKELRDYLYQNGFNCNGNHYVRFKRTSGSARVGKIINRLAHISR